MFSRARRWFSPYPDTVGALRLGFAAAYIGVVGALVVFTNFAGACAQPLPPYREWIMIGLLALMLFIERFELTRDPQPTPQPLAIGLVIVRAALVQGVVALDCTKLGIILYPVVPFAAFFALEVDVSRFIGMGYWLWAVVRTWQLDSEGLRTNPDFLTVVVIYTLLMIFMQVIARHIDRDQRSRQQMQRLLDELEASHRQLQSYADRVAELAAAAERIRLARDIHDSLGHYLTAISIQLEKAQVYRARSPEQADQAIRDARQTARAALQDVRQSVSALRASDDKFSLQKSLADLVGRVDRDTLAVDFHLEGDESDYAGPVLTTLYRVAQEGLTNVQKHARARHVTLDVRLGDTEAWLTLRDDGTGFDTGALADLPSSPEHSFGLQGLQERLELVRGQMRITSDPSRGTELAVIVPKHLAQ